MVKVSIYVGERGGSGQKDGVTTRGGWWAYRFSL